MYKLISIDMDKTLLNDEHKISTKTINSLKEAVNKGYEILINTGRTFSEFAIYLDELRFIDKFILCNGALLYNRDKDTFTNLDAIDNFIIEKAFDLSKPYSQEVSLVVSSEKYSYTDNIYLGGKGAVQHYNMCGNILDYVCDLKSILKGKRLEKGVMFGNSKILEIIKSELESNFADKANVLFSLENALEIIGKKTDKAIALKKISNMLGINKEDIIAIGDGINDLGMINYAGLGIAMGNAVEIVKETADFVTGSNNEDGIAFAIEKFII